MAWNTGQFPGKSLNNLLSTTNAISNTYGDDEVEPNYLLKCEWESRRQPVREQSVQIDCEEEHYELKRNTRLHK